MYIDIARVYFYSQTDYIRQTDIKLTSSNGYKSQKFVSLIDAPYLKNAFAPGASIRRNTVSGFGDKRQITGVFAGTLSGMFNMN
jgi:hypothetical protein